MLSTQEPQSSQPGGPPNRPPPQSGLGEPAKCKVPVKHMGRSVASSLPRALYLARAKGITEKVEERPENPALLNSARRLSLWLQHPKGVNNGFL